MEFYEQHPYRSQIGGREAVPLSVRSFFIQNNTFFGITNQSGNAEP